MQELQLLGAVSNESRLPLLRDSSLHYQLLLLELRNLRKQHQLPSLGRLDRHKRFVVTDRITSADFAKLWGRTGGIS